MPKLFQALQICWWHQQHFQYFCARGLSLSVESLKGKAVHYGALGHQYVRALGVCLECGPSGFCHIHVSELYF